MTLLKRAACVSVAVAVGIQFVRRARTNPATDTSRTLFARTQVPPLTAEVLQRACRDCHSNDTRWPWYSHVAPLSWFVIDHVNHGRSHFTYSDWAKYDPPEAQRLIKKSCELSRTAEMPLPSYLRLHTDARLTARDVEALCAWVAP